MEDVVQTQDNLIVVCEGGAHMIEYLQRNGVFPKAVILQTSTFNEVSPYLNEDSTILVIVKGFTDFTRAEMYALLKQLMEHKNTVKNITIMSNISLGVVPYDYYLYTGDLFYGDVKLVKNNKMYSVSVKDKVEGKKSMFGRKKVVEENKKNPVSFSFKQFDNPKVELLIYGLSPKTEVLLEEEKVYEQGIVKVDLYKDF